MCIVRYHLSKNRRINHKIKIRNLPVRRGKEQSDGSGMEARLLIHLGFTFDFWTMQIFYMLMKQNQFKKKIYA